jgi:CheY-like chemotaxis protein
VFTNNHMPRMGGAELVARLRGLFPALPVVHVDDLARQDPGPFLPGVTTLAERAQAAAVGGGQRTEPVP